MVSSRRPAAELESTTSNTSASRIVHRKIKELMLVEGTRDAGRARSVALDLIDQAVFVGILKSANAAGGFIECPETHVLFSRDLPVPPADCGGVPAGARVSFRVSVARGRPCVHGVRWPAEEEQEEGGGGGARGRVDEELSGMAAVLAHREGGQAPTWNQAAMTWRETREREPHAGMDSLLAHADGPGRSSRDWRPSVEADDRSGMAAALAHKKDPENYPMPQVRQGTFVGWKSN